MLHLFNQLEQFGNLNRIECATSIPSVKPAPVPSETSTKPAAKPAATKPAAKPAAKEPAVVAKQQPKQSAVVTCQSLTSKNMCTPVNTCTWDDAIAQCIDKDPCVSFKNASNCNKKTECIFSNNICKQYTSNSCTSLTLKDCMSKCYICGNTKTCMTNTEQSKALCTWIGHKNAYDKYIDALSKNAADAASILSDESYVVAPVVAPVTLVTTITPTSTIAKPKPVPEEERKKTTTTTTVPVK